MRKYRCAYSSEYPDEFMTVAEVAAILKLNQQTVRNGIDAGELPHVRIGRRAGIKRSDHDVLVAAGYRGAGGGSDGMWGGDVAPPDAPST